MYKTEFSMILPTLSVEYILLSINYHYCFHSKAYSKALIDSEQPYLAPLLMHALYYSEKIPSHDAFKSDVFSLGMTLLECCLLFSSQNYYDWENKKIRWNLIDEAFNRARQRYSGFLVNIIKEMLNKEENQRPSFQEVDSILAPYKNKIQSLFPFSADYITVKKSMGCVQPMMMQQSNVIYQPVPGFQPLPQNAQGINLLNQSISRIQTMDQSEIRYSPQQNSDQTFPNQFLQNSQVSSNLHSLFNLFQTSSICSSNPFNNSLDKSHSILQLIEPFQQQF